MLELARLGVAARPGLRAADSTTPDRIELFELEPHDVSSTEIRARVRRGEPIDGLVVAGGRRLHRRRTRLYAAD